MNKKLSKITDTLIILTKMYFCFVVIIMYICQCYIYVQHDKFVDEKNNINLFSISKML